MFKKLFIVIVLISIYNLAFVFAEENISGGEYLQCEEIIPAIEAQFDLGEGKTENTKEIVSEYCEIVLKQNKCSNSDNSFYDASESLFINYLCTNIDSGFSDKINELFDIEEGILKKHTFKELGFKSMNILWENYCEPSYDLNNCDIAANNSNLLQKIMNDYFDIAQSRIYGVQKLLEDPQEIINNFSKQNFVKLEICDTEKQYKNTCKSMEDYIREAKNLLRKTELIDTTKLLTETSSQCGDFTNKGYSFVYCGLVGNDSLPEVHFTNLVYNELMRYKLFESYYSNYTIGDYYQNFLTSEQKGLDIINQIINQKEYIKNYNSQTYQIQEAIGISLDSLFEIKNTFSYHIGLLMYQEDLYNLRKQLAKLYSPMITLNDKLRNVQDADS